jgi:parallel beta-helix repeat protein
MKQRIILKGLAVAVIILFIGVGIQPAIANKYLTEPIIFGNILYVGGSGEGNYTKIQDAIDDANPGDTVYVFYGFYEEQVKIDKQIFLIGLNKPLISTNKDYAIFIIADGCLVQNFDIQNTLIYYFGIKLQSNNNILKNLYVQSSGAGISSSESCNNFIINNVIKSGISLLRSHNNTISNNTISNNKWLINLEDSNDNIISNNIISYSRYYGIQLNNCLNGKILNNTIRTGEYGIDLEKSYNIKIKRNNILSFEKCGITTHVSDNTYISENHIKNCDKGILLDNCISEITSNIISNNRLGLVIGNADKKASIIQMNTIVKNNVGVSFYGSRHSGSIIKSNNISYNSEIGIKCERTHYDLKIFKNELIHNKNGIEILSTSDIDIFENEICYNILGINLVSSGVNSINKNNFIGNSVNAYFYDANSRWKKNYWDDLKLSWIKVISGKDIFTIYTLFPFGVYKIIEYNWYNFDWRPAKEPYAIDV